MNQLSFLRNVVILNGAVPLAMLALDAATGKLGANPVNIALHITGLLSLVFLVLSLLMTPLHWVTAWGGWIAFRRSLGLYGFFYAALHFCIYLVYDRALDVSSTLNEIWMRRFLQVGTIALVLMIPLAVTSTNGMIRRLGPKNWKRLHRLSYVVAILGVVHYYLLVKSDVRQPLAFAAVFAVLLSSRPLRLAFGSRRGSPNPVRALSQPQSPPNPQELPLVASNSTPGEASPRKQWKGQLTIAEHIQETPDVRTFRLINPHGGTIPFAYAAGQFINVQLEIDGKRVNRSYTLASSPTRLDSCELTIKREPLGVASRYLHDSLKVGDRLAVSGPAGRFVFDPASAKGVVLIAGGVGITPVMSILRTLAHNGWEQPIYFVFATKTQQDLIFRRELEALRHKHLNLQLYTTLTREPETSSWNGFRGRLTDERLKKWIPELPSLPVFLCGPNDMMDAVRESLERVGVPSHQIHTEAFAGKKLAKLDRSEPAAAATLDEPRTSTTTVHFCQSNKLVPVENGASVLELAEQANIDIPFECRSGICGQCKVRLLQGQVSMDSEDALSASEKSAGLILACQSRPLGSLVVEY